MFWLIVISLALGTVIAYKASKHWDRAHDEADFGSSIRNRYLILSALSFISSAVLLVSFMVAAMNYGPIGETQKRRERQNSFSCKLTEGEKITEGEKFTLTCEKKGK